MGRDDATGEGTGNQADPVRIFPGNASVRHAMCPGLKEYEEKFPERLEERPAFRELSARAH